MVGYMMWQQRNAAEFAEQQRVADSLATIQEQKRVEDSLLRVQRERDRLIEMAGEDEVSLTPEEYIALQDSVHLLEEVERMEDRFGDFGALAAQEGEYYTLENEQLELTFNSKGGALVKARLKEYQDYLRDDLILFDEGDHNLSWSFSAPGDRKIQVSELNHKIIEESDGKGVRFRLQAGSNSWVDQIYRFNDTAYLVDYNLEFNNFDRAMLNDRRQVWNLDWDLNQRRQETNLRYERQMSKAYYRYRSGDTDYKQREGSEDFNSKLHWVSYVGQFFHIALIAEENFLADGRVEVNNANDGDTTYTKSFSSRLYVPVGTAQSTELGFQFSLAPNNYQDLKKLDIELENVVPVGRSIIGWCNKLIIIPIFNWLNNSIASYGLIILILTLIIKMGLSPLTYRSYKSMAKMRVLKPEMDALKDKYKDDQQKMSRETMKLYQQTGVSPLGGCLPMLLQMPILFAMYRFFPNSIELRHEPFLWADDLSSYDSVLSLPFPFFDHLSLFTLLAAITSLIYARMNASMTPSAGPGMQYMQYLFPVMMIFFFNNFACGLTYYYLLQNVITFGQQFVMKKFFIDEDSLHKQIQENRSKPKKKGKWTQRFEAYQEAAEKMQEAKKKERQQAARKSKKRR
jgi:YidC/Oxa1 family membrane protein insertase